MKLLIIHYNGWLHWHIHKSDPEKHPIQVLEDWAFINPLIYSEFDKVFKISHHLSEPHQTAIAPEQAILSASYIMFVNPNEVLFKEARKNSEIKLVEENNRSHDVINDIGRFLINLRHVSKQFEIPTGTNNFFSFSFQEIVQLPNPNFTIELQHSHINKNIIDVAITWKQLEIAGNYPSTFTPPTFDTILLDAIHAFSSENYRRAILYSAMAVEIVAAAKLDEIYTSIIQSGNIEKRMRMVSVPQGSNQTIIKDPIYEYLKSKTDFAQLLHERPLYLLNKSLLIDDEPLYQTARKLYRTRNKIVHRGEPSPEEDTSHFSLNQADARAAIECAIEIFKWFGEHGDYMIPGLGFYEIGKSI